MPSQSPKHTRRSRTSPYNRLVTIAVAFGSFVCLLPVQPMSPSSLSVTPDRWQTYGYCSAIIGSTIGQPGWYDFFGLPMQGEPGYGSRTAQAIATANGLYSAGGAVGSLFIMWAATALGRKVCIQTGACCAVVGGAFQGGAANLA